MVTWGQGTSNLQTLYLQSNHVYEGQNMDNTILKLIDNAPDPGDILRGGTNWQNPWSNQNDYVESVTIRALTVDGNKDNGNQYRHVWNRQSGIYAQWSKNITIEDVKVVNAATVNIHLDSCQNSVIRRVTAIGAVWDGIHLGNMGGGYKHLGATVEDVYCENCFGIPASVKDHPTGWTGGSALDVGLGQNINTHRLRGFNLGAKGVYYDRVTRGTIEDCQVDLTNLHERSGGLSLYHCNDITVRRFKSTRSNCLGFDIGLGCNNISIEESEIRDAKVLPIQIGYGNDTSSNIEIHHCNIYPMTTNTHVIQNHTPNIVHAENNYWGTADRNTLLKLIPQNQNISWEPFLTQMFPH